MSGILGGGTSTGPDNLILVPKTIGGLAFWARGDFVSLSGTNVNAAFDQGSQGLSVSQTGTNRPTYNAADPAYNNQPTISFASGSTQFLKSAATISVNSQPVTLICVGEASQATSLQWLFSIGNSSLTPLAAILCEGTAVPGTMGAYAGSFINGTASSSAGIFAAVLSGSSSKVFVNKTSSPIVTNNAGTNGYGGNVFLGARSDSVQTLQGKLAECLAYVGDLSATGALSTLFQYLGARYGISAS